VKGRLQKVLAAAGVSSRRAAESLIVAGRVSVNGEIALIGTSADSDCDIIAIDGRSIRPAPSHAYLALHKPAGFVTSLRSTHGEATVRDLLSGVGQRVVPAGRLDRDTAGLLLLTSDGAWANIVTHPRYGVEKEYLARVRGRIRDGEVRHLREGLMLPDGTRTHPARVEVIDRNLEASRLSVTVMEGKKRQIRLMAEAVGHPIFDLRRVRVGSVTLGALEEGGWRHLHEWEIEGIRNHGSRSPGGEGVQPATPRRH